jgi:hypothetical protein
MMQLYRKDQERMLCSSGLPTYFLYAEAGLSGD